MNVVYFRDGTRIRGKLMSKLRADSVRFNCSVLVIAAFFAIVVRGVPVWAQTELSDPHAGGCLAKNGSCDKAAFQKIFADAKTFAVETRPKKDDLMGAGQVTRAIAAMGKTIQPEGPADLTFVLVHVDTTGVFDGAAGTALASLRIFRGSADAGGLFWTETFSGQTDMPWPNVVNSLLQQFRGELPKMPKR
jgi:hypothetical protein